MAELADGLTRGDDGIVRCAWGGSAPDYLPYHDREWGWPVADDNRLFEKICLEGFQSGLSWLTILRKRENFRAAFAAFDFTVVAHFGNADIERLVGDAGIIRHRGKITSTINNAKCAVALKEEFGSLAAYFWRFEPPADARPAMMDWATLRANPTTPASVRLSKDLKKRGWTFVGPTTVYAFMQAMGLVNDHIAGCACRDQVEAARSNFKRPG
ncbi:DNA-3-methyladenine glycosylase I [Tianweitania sediminis]|jgi:DNA-3-methyladenine glycosylase I|uniref:DNA-3-methyladenine glycosylase I n=1 Tax=Tianweitania sediminis TaxID=1502156 RepID=A0A8J7R062_9HYPH|nr:DNA-3-methyladenine glycosylase I [Tianweitania sediminis]MBP0438617.1 DNA-3-methyladenine glycosylase I [Tianweitania sediminis]HEV7415216.1 DNA-3-methyladenine glycosylase I [Tianweitania sediminis]